MSQYCNRCEKNEKDVLQCAKLVEDTSQALDVNFLAIRSAGNLRSHVSLGLR